MKKYRIVEYGAKRKRYRVERRTIFGNWTVVECERHNGFTYYDTTADFDTLEEAKELINPKPIVGKVVYEQ